MNHKKLFLTSICTLFSLCLCSCGNEQFQITEVRKTFNNLRQDPQAELKTILSETKNVNYTFNAYKGFRAIPQGPYSDPLNWLYESHNNFLQIDRENHIICFKDFGTTPNENNWSFIEDNKIVSYTYYSSDYYDRHVDIYTNNSKAIEGFKAKVDLANEYILSHNRKIFELTYKSLFDWEKLSGRNDSGIPIFKNDKNGNVTLQYSMTTIFRGDQKGHYNYDINIDNHVLNNTSVSIYDLVNWADRLGKGICDIRVSERIDFTKNDIEKPDAKNLKIRNDTSTIHE